MADIIKVEHLSYVYNPGLPTAVTALDDVSFTVEEGDFVGIIGATGSGKSTLITHMNGLNKPTSGKIYIDGRDLWADPEKIRDFRFLTGLVFHGLRRRSMKPVLLAALAHFLTVFGTAILQPHGVWVGEVYIFLMAMVLLLGPAPMLWPRRKAPVIPEGMEELSAPEEMAETEKTEATETEETQEEGVPQPSPEEK